MSERHVVGGGVDRPGSDVRPDRAARLAHERFVADIDAGHAGRDGREIAAGVAALLTSTAGERRANTLSLLASDNTSSAMSRSLLGSDLSTRVAEGLPGARFFPPGPINAGVDELEATLAHLAKRLFRAGFAEVRPLTTSMANESVLVALTRPGDAIMVHAMSSGGNMSYQAFGIAGRLGLVVHDLPADDWFGIDTERAVAAIERTRPRLIIVGGGKSLFPVDLTPLAEAAHRVGALVQLDAAHVGPLIAFGEHPDPFAQGADLITTGTHKMMGGPVGGLVLTEQPGLHAELSAVVHPSLLQTRDPARFAAAAVSLAEMVEFGAGYAAQCVANARRLAAGLGERGIGVFGAERRFTQTHQLFPHLPSTDQTGAAAERARRSGLLVHRSGLPGQTPQSATGMRLSVQEATRRGMVEAEMDRIADLLLGAFGAAAITAVRDGVRELLAEFAGVAYSFDDETSPDGEGGDGR